MFCRVALHDKTPGSVASDEPKGFRGWIKGLLGFVDGYHVQDSETGRILSITIWESKESMQALRRDPSGGLAWDRDGSGGALRRGGEVLRRSHGVYSPECVELGFSEVHLQGTG
jgi:heme-degrading monooxygenase HmoA